MDWVYKNRRVLLWALALLIIAALAWFVWEKLHPAQPVTGESQHQAETTEGVALAAKNAHITLLESQLTEAAKQIAELKNKPPVTVVQTVPVEVVKTVEVERQKSGADFAIVTEPKNPDKQVDLKQVAELSADTAVTLNQYNVYAYRKVIRGVNIYPDWAESVKNAGPRIREVSFDVSQRITKDGKYLGVVGGYNFKHEEVRIGLRYSF
ncbi:MAG TPA: hypothetical protein PKA28_10935 [Methylomusa anaerophila]|uniref:Uncharacterized protein n=1 Tax=Methylomusa anaerophila TaxID=1930071 RepID=A0A348AJ27_9FIRM|nr:hypothetical protein [Methylomusa anaerophila]BBB91075.1 hypothetical protein MAMMFC1_01743 [Methylomusa anaerophila]HML88950.1 hypothetical protein [Methylomusa anaerophila]